MRSPDQRFVQRCAIAVALIMLGLQAASSLSFAADPGPSSAPGPIANTPATSQRAANTALVTLVDINSATRAQLKTLPGIGDAEASRIVAGRPYLSKAELATKNVVPTGVYLSLKGRIIAIHTQQPKARD
jgi:competence protein ComEA